MVQVHRPSPIQLPPQKHKNQTQKPRYKKSIEFEIRNGKLLSITIKRYFQGVTSSTKIIRSAMCIFMDCKKYTTNMKEKIVQLMMIMPWNALDLVKCVWEGRQMKKEERVTNSKSTTKSLLRNGSETEWKKPVQRY